MRYAPPADTKKGSGKSFIRYILPGPPRSTEVARIEQSKNGERLIWVLRGNSPVSVSVRTGATDGARTQIVEGDLTPDDQVIVDTITAVD